MATIADLSKQFDNALSRSSNVFIRAYNSGTPKFVNAGRVKNGSIEHDQIQSEEDQSGRMSTHLYTITASFTMIQGSNVELSIVPDLAQPDTSQGTVYSNGHVVYFSGTNTLSTSKVNNNTFNDSNSDPLPDYSALSSDDPDGIVFVNVLLNPGPTLELDGGENVIQVEFQARVAPSAYTNFDDTTAQDGNHIVVSPE